ncbi:MAG: carboxypeptidase-like regulatory domain-containing protein, partial [Flavobacteriaceae bacterium]|nr:carboxypeptidase-like regulatory domain-containing protein [Flavobacteriaceae bacterium]
MRKRTNQIRVVLSLLFLLPLIVNAQQNKKRKLVEIFTIIQKLHGIQFNYAEDIVKEIAIIPPSKNLSLKAVLTYLEKYTGLRFVLMNTNFVLVKPSEGLIICGYLKDNDNLFPLPNVVVQGIYNTTISDKNGYFEIKVASKNELIIMSHIGYQTNRKTYQQLKKGRCEVIVLKSNLFALSEVVLSDYITTGINKINNGSFEIDFSKFDILPGLIDHDVLHSIQAFPGIFSVNETVSTINIRGGTNDQNLMLWDHIKMYQSGHFFGLISMYNPQITHKVTLRKNGSDASFTDGVSGTIDMRTDTKVTKNFTANIGMNLTDLNGFADIPIGSRSSLQIAVRKSISDFFVTPTYTEFFNRISQGTEVETNTSGVSTNTDKSFDFYDTSLRWIYK